MIERWSDFWRRCAKAESLGVFLKSLAEGREVWFSEITDEVFQRVSQQKRKSRHSMRVEKKSDPYASVFDSWTGERIDIEDPRHPDHISWEESYVL